MMICPRCASRAVHDETCGDCGLPLPEQSDSQRLALVKKRAVHLASGEVWRYAGVHPVRWTDRVHACIYIERESDGVRRCVAEDYWLGTSWAAPRSRAGCRS